MTVVFLRGDDEALMAEAVKKAVDGLVGDADRSLMVEELTEATYLEADPPSLAAVVSAAQTPPFLTERRLVVARHLGLFSKQADVLGLVELLASPPETTDLVLVWEKASASTRMPAVPKPLLAALESVGAEMLNPAPSGKGRKALLEEKLATAPVVFDQSAKRAIIERIGEDLGRLGPLFEILQATFGAEAKVSSTDVEPFLGQGADVPPWELTDAIDKGDIRLSLEKLERMTAGGGRHPLQILATLHGHYQRALRLDGAPVFDEKSAAAHLGISGSTFPAKKALQLTRKMGPARLSRAVQLVAEADVGLRGASGLPSETIVSVLVARLANLSR